MKEKWDINLLCLMSYEQGLKPKWPKCISYISLAFHICLLSNPLVHACMQLDHFKGHVGVAICVDVSDSSCVKDDVGIFDYMGFHEHDHCLIISRVT